MGPSAKTGKKDNPQTMTMIKNKSVPNNIVSVRKLPSEDAVFILLPKLAETKMTEMMTLNLPTNIQNPRVKFPQRESAAKPANAEPLLFDADPNA